MDKALLGKQVINKKSLVQMVADQYELQIPQLVWDNDFLPMVSAKAPNFSCNSSSNCVAIGVNCTQAAANLENLVFKVGIQEYTLPPLAYTEYDGFSCYLNVVPNPDSTKTWTAGEMFFNNFIVSFDYSKNEIKIATSISGDAAGATSAHKLGAAADIFITIGAVAAAVGLLVGMKIVQQKFNQKAKEQATYS
jgi:hypothetical protein